MKIEPSNNSGMVLIDCLECGRMYEVTDFRHDQFSAVATAILEQKRVCPDCETRLEQEAVSMAENAKKTQILERLPELIAKSGIPTGYSHDRDSGELFVKPPVYFVAEWLWRNHERHILLSGETGCGKSTSACFVAAKLLLEYKRIKYTSLRKLLADWRNAKTSDRSYAAEQLLEEIFRTDVFIIDEVIGKARVSLSGEELLFEILESVNSGSCHARIWLLGNFYSGSIEDTFSEPEPVRRRLQENFICANVNGGKIERMTVWQRDQQKNQRGN